MAKKSSSGRGPDTPEIPPAEPAAPPRDQDQFEALLDYIKRSRGFDFTGYKRASLERRVRRRMQTLSMENYEVYLAHLGVDPQEFAALFNTVLINVTDFFRDPAAWEYLSQDVLPRIIGRKEAHEPIRVWSAGVASGEEAYSVAMLLAELLGEGEFHERVKIYATDVDEEALAHARQAAYTAVEVSGVSPQFLEKYFERTGAVYSFRKDVRRSVIFGHHDIMQDAPISRVDLLICRNTLMYFNLEAQGRILTRFHFALNDDGYLFLGRAEMLFTHSDLFVPLDLRRRVFAKVLNLSIRERALAAQGPDGSGTSA